MKVCAVQYLPKQTAANQPPTQLSCIDTPMTFEYLYADDKDTLGKIKN